MTRSRLAVAALAALALIVPTSAASGSAMHRTDTDRARLPLLGPNRVAMGDQVPWRQVGDGWYLTLIAQGTRGDFGINAERQLLDLVDPRGGRYQLSRTSVAEDGTGYRSLAGWSASGRTALLLVDQGTKHARAVRLDLRSGSRRVLPLGPGVATISMGPGGSVFAAMYGGNRGEPVVRLDPDGTSLPIARHTGGVVLPTPDARQVVVAPESWDLHELRLVDGRGHLIRTLPTPRPCTPARWWNAETVLATCSRANGVTRLYAVPLDGSTPRPVSADHGGGSSDLGDLDARRLGGTTYLEASGPCGVVFLARQHADGSATRVRVPDSVGNVYLIGRHGHRLVLQTGVSCDGGTARDAITHFDPVTRDNEVVAELPLNEAYATILAFGERRTTFG
jgi:TolB protein